MDQTSRALRLQLRSMAPVFSIPYIRSFQLPEEEELVLIQHECKGKSLQQISMEMNVSVETVKRRRKSALNKIHMTQL